ncbi:MAG: tRNA pseudouridine(55) synthase TruB [Actinobacteria bacterium]|nr:tRNA pseudouridine(55) synthase TruB [Actinomycetota bacterium]
MDGFLLIDKAGGMTSHDVVAMARKRLDIRKVGHAGTLDPMATGVLVLGVGIATRLLTYITDGKKGYEATIFLGNSTHTDDKDGDLTFTASPDVVTNISDEQIKVELNKFIGEIKQRPSSVSAIKIDGKTAHARVRAGESVEIAERDVNIYELVIKEIRHLPDAIEVDILVTCSAGTYIRAIARDLGAVLKTGGHLTYLRRTMVSPFVIDQCKQIKDADLIPIGGVVEKLFPIRKLELSQSKEISFGRVIEQNSSEGVFAALDNQGNFVALLENKLQGSQIVAAPILVKGSG